MAPVAACMLHEFKCGKSENAADGVGVVLKARSGIFVTQISFWPWLHRPVEKGHRINHLYVQARGPCGSRITSRRG